MINFIFLLLIAVMRIKCIVIDLRETCPCRVYLNLYDCLRYGRSFKSGCIWMDEKCQDYSEVCQDIEEDKCTPGQTSLKCVWDGNGCINKNSTCADAAQEDCPYDLDCYINKNTNECEEFSSCSNYRGQKCFISGKCTQRNEDICEDYHCDHITDPHLCSYQYPSFTQRCLWRDGKCIIIPRYDCSILVDIQECGQNYECKFDFTNNICIEETKCGATVNWLCRSLYKSEYILTLCGQIDDKTCIDIDPRTATSLENCYGSSLSTYYWTSQGKCEKCSGMTNINTNNSSNSTNNSSNSINNPDNSTNNSSNSTQSTETQNNSTIQANSTTNPNNSTDSQKNQPNNSTKTSSSTLIIQVQILIGILIII